MYYGHYHYHYHNNNYYYYYYSESERGELAFSSESTMAAKAACHDLDEMD